MPGTSNIWDRLARVIAFESTAWGGIGPRHVLGGHFIQPDRPWTGVVDLDALGLDDRGGLDAFFHELRDPFIVRRFAFQELWYRGDRIRVQPTDLTERLLAGDRRADGREQVLVLVAYDPNAPAIGRPERALRMAYERLGGDGSRFHLRLFDASFAHLLADLNDPEQRSRMQADLPAEQRGEPFDGMCTEAIAAYVEDLVGGRDQPGICAREAMIIANLHKWGDHTIVRDAAERPWARALHMPLSERYARWVARETGESEIEYLAMYEGARVLAAPGTRSEIPEMDPLFGQFLESIDDALLPDEMERIWRVFCGA